MTKDAFAESLDYLSYDTLKSESTLTLLRNDYYHYNNRNDNSNIPQLLK